jgi:hypothetical protein
VCPPEASGGKNNSKRTRKSAGLRPYRKIPDSGLRNSAFFRASLVLDSCIVRLASLQLRPLLVAVSYLPDKCGGMPLTYASARGEQFRPAFINLIVRN